jgi:acyl-CoA reductase-like NAD-dependent aldehyde dehydrogenase
VQESVYDRFVAKASEMAKSIRVGPQFDGTSQQGPQVDDLQFKSVMRYIELGKSQGATVLAGGDRHGSKGYYVQPTVFGDVTDEMTIAKEEVSCALCHTKIEASHFTDFWTCHEHLEVQDS